MYTGNYAPWDHYPKLLRHKEVQDPISVIKDFFSADSPKGHKKHLKRWRKYALSDTYFNDERFGPGTLLYTHELNIKLLEAAHMLLLNYQSSYTKQFRASAEQLQEEKETWSYFPKNLSEEELLDPLKAIKKLFKDLSIPQYREHLNEWLNEALTTRTSSEGIEAADILLVYRNMLRLYSATWLILQRSAEPTLKKDPDPVVESPPESTLSKAKAYHEVSLYDLNVPVTPGVGTQLAKAIAIIKHKVPTVQAMIHLGSVPGNLDTIFLLVITSNEEQKQAQALSGIIEESCREVSNVVALVHHASIFFNGQQNGDRFFNKALSCPVVFLSGDLLLPQAKTGIGTQSAPSEVNLANWEHWHKQGIDFLEGAEGYLKKNAAAAALFSLHQCVECLLIAVIRVVLGYRINNHNLTTLLRISRMFTNSLTEVFNLEDTEDARLFELLKHAYVNVRYKDQFEPDIKDADTLYQVTKYFVSATEAVYQKFILSNTL
jgi:HEPN domain-containing protein